MPRFLGALLHGALPLCLALAAVGTVPAQRHSLGSAPPTVPPIVDPHSTPAAAPSAATPHAAAVASANHASAAGTGPIAVVSSGLGAIQFSSANASVPAPQTLVRQLSAEDERIRLAALTALGAPAPYLTHGHAAAPHSLQLDLLQLGNTDDLDAILTIELDQHILSAVLVPEDGNWRRVATLAFASAFSSGTTTPANFVRPLRSWLQPGRYRAVYHAMVDGSNGTFIENEADVRVLNGHAAVVLSFVSASRQCEAAGPAHPAHTTCEILQRWVEPDPADPAHHFTLVTGTGHLSVHEGEDALVQSRPYRLTRLRAFSCQPLVFAENLQHFEPVANSAPCLAHEGPPSPPHTDHADRPEHADHP